jgi:hypothetical protein
MEGLPQGYRTGIITSISVFLGFSLAFIRFWGFEAPGKWGWASAIGITLIGLSAVIQIYTLFRALDLNDETPKRYRKTVRWFIGGISVLLAGVVECMWAITQ